MKRKIFTLIAMALCSTLPSVFGQTTETRVELFGNDHFITTKNGEEFKIILDKEPGESVSILLHPSGFAGKMAFFDIQASKFANVKVYKYDENQVNNKEVEIESFHVSEKGKKMVLNLNEFNSEGNDSIWLSLYVEPKDKWQGKITLRVSDNNESATESAPIKIYPNPASAQITIQCNEKGTGVLSIFDELGLLQLQKADIENTKKTTVSTSSLRSGNYKAIYITNNKTYSCKLTVIHQ